MEARAYQLAAGGNHVDYQTIEPILIAEGFPEAPEWLRLEWARSDLKALCDLARRKRSDSLTKP
jgi:hypothetical protein